MSTPTIQSCCKVRSACVFSVLPLTASVFSGVSADCASTLDLCESTSRSPLPCTSGKRELHMLLYPSIVALKRDTVCVGRRRRADSTRAGTIISGAEQRSRFVKLSPTHTCKPPPLSCCGFRSWASNRQVVFCDNLPSAAPSVRRTESAARLL